MLDVNARVHLVLKALLLPRRSGPSALSERRVIARDRSTEYAHRSRFADAPPEGGSAPWPSRRDPRASHLRRRLAEGCRNAQLLGRGRRAQGYPGTSRQVPRWAEARRECAPAGSIIRGGCAFSRAEQCRGARARHRAAIAVG
jgi:hypothetical protein